MSIPLPEDIKRRIQEIADKKGYEVRDPGSLYGKGREGMGSRGGQSHRCPGVGIGSVALPNYY